MWQDKSLQMGGASTVITPRTVRAAAPRACSASTTPSPIGSSGTPLVAHTRFRSYELLDVPPMRRQDLGFGFGIRRLSGSGFGGAASQRLPSDNFSGARWTNWPAIRRSGSVMQRVSVASRSHHRSGGRHRTPSSWAPRSALAGMTACTAGEKISSPAGRDRPGQAAVLCDRDAAPAAWLPVFSSTTKDGRPKSGAIRCIQPALARPTSSPRQVCSASPIRTACRRSPMSARSGRGRRFSAPFEPRSPRNSQPRVRACAF